MQFGMLFHVLLEVLVTARPSAIVGMLFAIWGLRWCILSICLICCFSIPNQQIDKSLLKFGDSQGRTTCSGALSRRSVLILMSCSTPLKLRLLGLFCRPKSGDGRKAKHIKTSRVDRTFRLKLVKLSLFPDILEAALSETGM